MSAVLQQPSPGPAQPPAPAAGKGSLLRAELHRLRARRFLQVVLGLALLAWVAAALIGLSIFGIPTEADRAAAERQREQFVAEENDWREDCLDEMPEGASAEEWCGPEIRAADYPVEDFLETAPFRFASDGDTGAMAFAFGAAVLAFVGGATWIGAEWSSRSLVALLFWVPRRLQVMGTKIAVLVLAAALFGLLAQVCWLALAGLLHVVAGQGSIATGGFWEELLGVQARGVLLVVLAALGGFGLTNLVRNTGAALGIGFVYFAIVEPAVGLFAASSQPWLLSNNVIGLLVPGGHTVYLFDIMETDFADFEDPAEYLIGNLQAGLVLGVAVAVVVAIGVALFTRRDLH